MIEHARLEVSEVHKSYGDVVALAGVDLRIAAGEIVGLLGPNGAGKTTLVSIIAGLERADSGRVLIDGRDVERHSPAVQRRLGIAPQDLGVYPTLNVRDNIRLFGELHGLRGRQLKVRVNGAIDALGLSGLAGRPVRVLSGGQKRLVHTAMALVHRPRVLLLDEPTTGVDVATRNDLLTMIESLAADDEIAICYSTHYLTEVERIASSVFILDEGHVIARGSLDEVARLGASALELTFQDDGLPLPEISWPQEIEIRGRVLRLSSPDPASEVASALTALGTHRSRLASLDFVRPSLESLFLSMTGRRFHVAGTEEQVHAVS